MASFLPSTIKITSEILHLLEAIARRQGELSALKREVRDDQMIEGIAAVDAVHYSTKIEGNALTRDQVTLALGSKRVKTGVRDLNEVLNYSRTRKLVRDWALRGKALNHAWVLEHHSEILRGIVKGKLRGHYREAQCVIQDAGNRKIVFMAPEWRDVPGLMDGLLRWLKQQLRSGASPLLVAAQFHFEFVTIHPFMDGNGRLGRLLTNGILLVSNYDVERAAALEKQHELSRRQYYQALGFLQAGNYYEIPLGQDIQTWVLYWLTCLLHTYEEGLVRLRGLTLPTVGTEDSTNHERLRKARALFIRHTRLRASEYADLMNLGRTQAVADLNVLLESKLIVKVGGGRSTVYRIRGGA